MDRRYGKGKPLELFYTDAFLRQAYKDWIKKIVTRTNTITKQRYIDDPTILAWEIANEPRNPRDRSGKQICNWVHDIAKYIK